MVIWRGLGGHTFKNVGNMPNSRTDRDHVTASKPLDRLGPNVAHVYSPGNGRRLNKINPSSPKGNLEEIMGSKIQKCGKDAKQLY